MPGLETLWASQVTLVVKNLPVNGEDLRDVDSIPVSGRSPGEGNGNPLQYTCLGNPMDRGAWRAAVLVVIESQMQLSTLETLPLHLHGSPICLLQDSVH